MNCDPLQWLSQTEAEVNVAVILLCAARLTSVSPAAHQYAKPDQSIKVPYLQHCTEANRILEVRSPGLWRMQPMHLIMLEYSR